MRDQVQKKGFSSNALEDAFLSLEDPEQESKDTQ